MRNPQQHGTPSKVDLDGIVGNRKPQHVHPCSSHTTDTDTQQQRSILYNGTIGRRQVVQVPVSLDIVVIVIVVVQSLRGYV